MTTEIDWAIRSDIPGILAAEASTLNPIPEEQLLGWLRQRDIVGISARVGKRKDKEVVGYCVYRLHKKNLEILRLVVLPKYRDNGIGTQLLRKLRDKAGNVENGRRRRSSVICELSSFEDIRMLDWLGNRASFVRPTENGVRFIFTPYREEV